MSLSINIVQSDEELLKLKFSGKLDTISVGENEMKFHALLNGQNSPVILDFSEVTFLASMGIRMLLVGMKDLKRQGFDMKIENVSADIRKIFDIAGLSLILG